MSLTSRNEAAIAVQGGDPHGSVRFAMNPDIVQKHPTPSHAIEVGDGLAVA